MKKLLLLFMIGCSRADFSSPDSALQSDDRYEVHFSPNGGCEAATVQHIDAARESIRVQAYSFTSKPIAQALVRAKQRGLNVEVILDKSNLSDKSELHTLTAGSVPTVIDSKHAIAHSKEMLFDRSVVLTGSYNYSAAGDRSNWENCLFIRDFGLAAKYELNWREHWKHSDSASPR